MSKDNILNSIQPCVVASEQHAWVPTTGEGLQCYSCPMCLQRIYWSGITKKWVKVDPKVELADHGYIKTDKEKV